MFKIAIVGRANVGKSTLFNRLVGKSFAITNDISGVTRDRKEAFGQLGPLHFKVIDTAGIEELKQTSSLNSRMSAQSELAIAEADLCLFVVDGRVGITTQDQQLANFLRKKHNQYLLVINKMEGKDRVTIGKEFYQLGFGDPVSVSAEHQEGFIDLYDNIAPFIEKYEEKIKEDSTLIDEIEEKADLQIAIVGRPNAGKSTLINRIIAQERMITGPEAGITRDSIAIDHNFQGKKIRFIDTAGIRRKALINQVLEAMAVRDSMRAVNFAQVVILLIDANIALDKQDLSIARQILQEGRVIIFAINKIDQIKGDKEQFLRDIREKLQNLFVEVAGSTIIGISAITGYNIDKMLRFALESIDQWKTYLKTAKLYEWLSEAKNQHKPKMYHGRETKIKYITQIKSNPPTFAVFTNHPDAVIGDYQRYLINKLRQDFSLNLTPIRLVIRKSENPFAIEKKDFKNSQNNRHKKDQNSKIASKKSKNKTK